MGADSIRHDRQGVTARRQFGSCALGYSFYNDCVDGEGEMESMLLCVPDRDQDHFAAFGIGGKLARWDIALPVWKRQKGLTTRDVEKGLWIQSLWCQAIDAREPIISQTVQQI